MSTPEPPAVPVREARRARREAEWARRDAEAEQRARVDARIDDAAAAAPSVLPGKVGEALAAVLAAMKPFRAADGYLAFSAVGRSSDEVVALAEAILAVHADPAADTGQAREPRKGDQVRWTEWDSGTPGGDPNDPEDFEIEQTGFIERVEAVINCDCGPRRVRLPLASLDVVRPSVETVQAPATETFLATIAQQMEQIVSAGRVPGSVISYQVQDWAAAKAAEVRALLGAAAPPGDHVA